MRSGKRKIVSATHSKWRTRNETAANNVQQSFPFGISNCVPFSIEQMDKERNNRKRRKRAPEKAKSSIENLMQEQNKNSNRITGIRLNTTKQQLV